MRISSVLLTAELVGLVPALELGIPIGASGVGRPRGASLATFVPACELVPPRVTSVYTGSGEPSPHRRDSPVEVFLAGDRPRRPYIVIGELQVATENRNTSLSNLLDYAKREARRLGGDAIVDVRPPGAPVDHGQRILTAKVASWSG